MGYYDKGCSQYPYGLGKQYYLQLPMEKPSLISLTHLTQATVKQEDQD